MYLNKIPCYNQTSQFERKYSKILELNKIHYKCESFIFIIVYKFMQVNIIYDKQSAMA